MAGREDEFIRDQEGIWIKIHGNEYVTPAERVRKVISGEHRKAAVFEGRGWKFV